MINRKEHWDKIYNTKNFEEVSWYQKKPIVSLTFLDELKVEKNAKIIDIGGGDSYFVDFLLELGYSNLTVLDISLQAIERAKKRLGNKANNVTWIVSDISDFQPEEKYDLWHDRAAFHFLTDENEIAHYISTVSKSINSNGKLIIGTFSENGPTKCSGIEIKQYSQEKLTQKFSANFEKLKCLNTDHQTPFNTLQNFTFCSFKRK